jgi:hypothetical protein
MGEIQSRHAAPLAVAWTIVMAHDICAAPQSDGPLKLATASLRAEAIPATTQPLLSDPIPWRRGPLDRNPPDRSEASFEELCQP